MLERWIKVNNKEKWRKGVKRQRWIGEERKRKSDEERERWWRDGEMREEIFKGDTLERKRWKDGEKEMCVERLRLRGDKMETERGKRWGWKDWSWEEMRWWWREKERGRDEDGETEEMKQRWEEGRKMLRWTGVELENQRKREMKERGSEEENRGRREEIKRTEEGEKKWRMRKEKRSEKETIIKGGELEGWKGGRRSGEVEFPSPHDRFWSCGSSPPSSRGSSPPSPLHSLPTLLVLCYNDNVDNKYMFRPSNAPSETKTVNKKKIYSF